MNNPNRRSSMSPVGLLRVLSGMLALLALTTSLHAQTTVAEAGLVRGIGRAIASARTAPDSGSAPPVVSSDSPAPDRPLRFVVGAFVSAAAADVSISMYQIQRGVVTERGLGAGWQDSPVPFALTKGAMAATFVYGLRELRKTKPRTALVLGLAASAVEVSLAVRSARLGAARR